MGMLIRLNGNKNCKIIGKKDINITYKIKEREDLDKMPTELSSNPFYNESLNILIKTFQNHGYGKPKKDKTFGNQYINFSDRLFCFGCDEERNGIFRKYNETFY